MGNAILKGQTGGASPTVISQKKLTLLADVTIYSARTSVDFTGLNVGADTELLLVLDIYNGGTSAGYNLTANGYGLTNYYTQYLFANGTSITSGRFNSSEVISVDSGNRSFANVKIKLTNNGYFVFQTDYLLTYGNSSIRFLNEYVTSTVTMSAINTLTISTGAGQIGVGSRFQLYSLNTGGEKTWVTS